MIILHAAQTEIGLLVWGETKPKGTPRPRMASGKKRASKVPVSPFDPGREAIREILTKDIGLSRDTLLDLEAAAWLPSVGDEPVASSPMVADQQLDTSAASIKLWKVSAVLVEGDQALSLLASCAGKQILSPGILVGNDLAYWADMLRYGGSIVARQQYLPGVRSVGDDFHAVWEPMFLGDDARLLSEYASLMPHSARALGDPDSAQEPRHSSVSMLKGFLTDIVDTLVRQTDNVSRASPRRRSSANTFESIHDAWLAALSSVDGLIVWDGKDVQELKSAIRRWKRPLDLISSAPARLCFRLEEPKQLDPAGAKRPPRDVWRVSYLLQPYADQSLLMPIGDYLNHGKGRVALKALNGVTREFVLSGLGQAAELCPNIAASLHSAVPDGHDLTTREAYEFLTERAQTFQQAGFGVLLPSWWTGKGTRLRPSVRAEVKTPQLAACSGLSLESIVSFNWQASLGDERLTLKELKALAKIKAPLVQLRGQWVEVNAQAIQAAIAFWEKQDSETTTVREIIRMSLGGKETEAGFDFAGVSATGWMEEFLSQLQGQSRYAEIEPPASFSGTLRPYQRRGYSWLCFLRQWGLGACLADDMGLGKTIQTLTLILHDWEKEKHPTLLVCPTSVVANWYKEAQQFAPSLPVMIHHGLDRKKDMTFKRAAEEHALVVSSYGLLQRDLEAFKQVAWAGVILDEAQNIKNPETKQARAARSIPSQYRVALTGTPVENNVGDLWSIMEFLNSGFLGSQAAFRRRFFIPIQSGREPEAAERLKRLTSPFILRRLKTDSAVISDLPEKMEMKEFCPLTKEQVSLYAAVVKNVAEELEEAEGIKRRGLVLATLLRLKQICNHPAHFLGDNSSVAGRSGKLSRLLEMLDEILAVGDKALIFTQFKEMGDILQNHLQETLGQEALFLHGGVSRAQREKMVERFQAGKKGAPLFILSLKAGGTGLNLTAANHVFHFDRWWNPAVEDQATDRAFRIGQKRAVMVHKYICAGTLEEKIDTMIDRKKELAGSVVGTGEAWLTELSNEELKSLFALSTEVGK